MKWVKEFLMIWCIAWGIVVTVSILAQLLKVPEGVFYIFGIVGFYYFFYRK